jgi:hypothetical protein
MISKSTSASTVTLEAPIKEEYPQAQNLTIRLITGTSM